MRMKCRGADIRVVVEYSHFENKWKHSHFENRARDSHFENILRGGESK